MLYYSSQHAHHHLFKQLVLLRPQNRKKKLTVKNAFKYFIWWLFGESVTGETFNLFFYAL